MDKNTEEKATNHLKSVMDRIIDNRTINNPFDESAIFRNNPFGARLVPMEVWKGSKFERSFVTSLGQGVYEQLARIIAEGSGAIKVENQYVQTLEINTFRNSRIEDILKKQRQSKSSPDWEKEVEGLLLLEHTDTTRVRIISDVYVERQDGQKEHYSLKTVKPNLDQTEIAKKDMLQLKAYDKDYETYFALPFNPAGEGVEYRKSGHSLPYKIFNMDKDEAVLIGSDFWNKIGNDPNTYNNLLKIFEEVGEYSSERIRKEYLEIE